MGIKRTLISVTAALLAGCFDNAPDNGYSASSSNAIAGAGGSTLGAGSGSSSGSGSATSGSSVNGNVAQGYYVGQTTNERYVQGIVLDTGQYWFVYSSQGGTIALDGLLEGTETTNGGTLTTSDGRDFNLEVGLNDFTGTGSYQQGSSLDVTITYSAGSVEQGATLEPQLAYNSSYTGAAYLSSLAGNYSGPSATLGGGDVVTFSVTSSGSISGSSTLGCGFTGTASPHANGNVFDVSIEFAGGDCSNGSSTVTGIAWVDPTTNTLISTALNSDRSNGFIVEATRL